MDVPEIFKDLIAEVELGTLPDWLVLAVAVAVFAWKQIHSARDIVRVQRVIDLHCALTAGEVGQARERLSTLMWRQGRAMGRGTCCAPKWGELLPVDSVYAQHRGSFASYPHDMLNGLVNAKPLSDLYAVLWTFERIEAARVSQALDEEMLQELIGPHAVWWYVATLDDTMSKTRYISSLRQLVGALETPQLRTWAKEDFS